MRSSAVESTVGSLNYASRKSSARIAVSVLALLFLLSSGSCATHAAIDNETDSSKHVAQHPPPDPAWRPVPSLVEFGTRPFVMTKGAEKITEVYSSGLAELGIGSDTLPTTNPPWSGTPALVDDKFVVQSPFAAELVEITAFSENAGMHEPIDESEAFRAACTDQRGACVREGTEGSFLFSLGDLDRRYTKVSIQATWIVSTNEGEPAEVSLAWIARRAT